MKNLYGYDTSITDAMLAKKKHWYDEPADEALGMLLMSVVVFGTVILMGIVWLKAGGSL